jgi:hypothetical protein
MEVAQFEVGTICNAFGHQLGQKIKIGFKIGPQYEAPGPNPWPNLNFNPSA